VWFLTYVSGQTNRWQDRQTWWSQYYANGWLGD